MAHPIIKDLEARYTAKHYDKNKRISDEDLFVIKDAMRLTPSSINSQPWRFIIIESDEAKERLHGTFENNFQFNQKHALGASHTILFAYNPRYNKDDYTKVVEQGIADGRTKPEEKDDAMGAYAFVELNTDDDGYNGEWTKAQIYIALGNTLHTLARLNIDSTTMEGVDADAIGKEFAKELDGYVCCAAIAIGYRDSDKDYNAPLPKSRFPIEEITTTI